LDGMHVVIKPPRPTPARPAIEVLRELYDAVNARDWDAVAARIDPNVEWFHAGRHELVRGVDGIVGMLRANAEAFPNARIEVRALRDAGAVVVAEWTVVNPRASRVREVEKPAIVCEVIETRRGRIVKGSTYGDILTLMMEFSDEYRAPLRAVC
jgi:ketosteroid isomerase-like protein